jgi:hypothetical protein
MSNKVVYAIYNDDDILMDAVKNQSSPSSHRGSFTFPVHGLIKQWALRLPD